MNKETIFDTNIDQDALMLGALTCYC